MPVSRLYRSAGLFGLASALVLAFNAARRAGLVPSTGFTHALAPLGAAFGLLALIGLYLLHRERSGRAGQAAFVLNFLGLCGLLGGEFITNLIFPALTKAQTDALLHGPTGKVLAIASVVFLVGSAMFGATMWRFAVLPRAASVAYVAGSALIALRAVLPSAAFDTGVLIAAGGIGVLSFALSRQDTSHMRTMPVATGAARS